MLLSVFQKNEKKDYLKRIGVKFSKDELKINYFKTYSYFYNKKNR